MKRNQRRSVGYLALLLPVLAWAQAPDLLGYQGRLIKNDGTPEEGNTQMRFGLYAANVGGTALWEEDQTLTLIDGYYATHLGKTASFSPTLFDTGTLYLEVAVRTATDTAFKAMSPRQRVGSVAWALMAKSLKGGSVEATSVTINGNAAVAVNMSGCNSGQVLQWNGSSWACAQVSGGGSGSVTQVSGIGPVSVMNGSSTPVVSVAVGTTTGTVAAGDDSRFGDATELRGRNVSTMAPSNGDVLTWNGSAWVPGTPGATGVTSVGTGSGLTGGPITGAGTISVATGGVSTTHLANGAVTAAKLASNGCATDQIMKWNGSAWACANLPASTAIECPGPVISGTCLLKYDNIANINFQTAAQVCANLGGDLCTDSQSWPLTLGWWQNQYIGPTVVIRPHWTASFADNDNGYWTGSNGGTGDDHSANTGYGYACCGGARPPHPRVPIVTSASGVRYTALHDVNDTTFAGATAYCSALNSDICSDSQTFLLRKDSLLTQRSWTNSHADNDASGYNAINGGTSDDTHPSHESGFACCPSLRPVDLSCPVTRTSAVCATFIYNTANRTFDEAASDCAVRGADLCSTGQSAVLRVAGSLTVNKVWTNSHSDNDSSNASIGVGASMPDNPNLTTDLSGYACCLN